MAPAELHEWADISAIATFVLAALGSVVGLWGYMRFLWEIRQKRLKLEDYLQRAAQKDDLGRSVLRITGEIGLTENEIIQASFRSKHVGRRRVYDEAGLTRALVFFYKS